MAMNQNVNNGATPEVSALAQLHAQYIQSGAKEPTKEQVAAIKKELLAAEKAYEEAAKALEKAQEMKQTAAVKAVQIAGSKRRFDLGGGRIMVPSCRGQAVFYRRMGEEAETL